MEIWHIWVILALILVIVEIITSGFAVICFSAGALAGAITAAAGCEIKTQIIWFAAVSLIAFVTVRPVLLKYLHRKKHRVATNADALIGRTAVVSEKIDPENGTGRVKIDGDDILSSSLNKSSLSGSTYLFINCKKPEF